MDPLLLVSTLVLFLLSIAGGAAPKCVASLSPQWMELANAVAGGVIIAVALVHMLVEGSEGLHEWGVAAAEFVKGDSGSDDPGEAHDSDHHDHDHGRMLGHGHGHGGDEEAGLPVGNMLFIAGFFLIMFVEQWLPHHHKVVHKSHDEGEDGSDDSASEMETAAREHASSVEVVRKSDAVAAVSVSVGMFLHAFVEGLAAGVAASATLFLAIAVHKAFGAFAVGNALLPVTTPAFWWLGIILFALCGTVGIFIGACIAEAVEGPVTAALTCFAGGTLMCVGIVDMLLPALASGGVWAKRKLVASFLASLIVAALAIWG